ncbi:phage tail protein [Paenibacillus sp. UNC451MF]|uniref:phage tail protein n=1 Tax=Paenibacillus sp. UNC451MF TaxID=1449063 RepID=UPI00055CD8D9|nr:phage tail protein [Paenibacillus sp. UNC451MF]
MMKVDAAELKIAEQTIRTLKTAAPRVFASALNRTAQGVKTEAVKKVRETYEVKATDIRPLVKVRHKASAQDLRAEVASSGRSIPLIRFKTNPRNVPKRAPKSLKATVKKGAAKLIKGAFVTKAGGHVGVFSRVGKKRLPIEQLYGPAMPVMLNQPGVISHLRKEAQQRLKTRMDHEVKRVLERKGSK